MIAKANRLVYMLIEITNAPQELFFLLMVSTYQIFEQVLNILMLGFEQTY